LARKKKGYTRDEEGYMKPISMLEDALNEIDMLKVLSHKNIITVLEIIENRDTDKLYLGKMFELTSSNGICIARLYYGI
jgi:hypothetical protein